MEVVRKACDLWPDVAPYIRYWRTDPQREPSPDATGPEALIVGADPDEAVIEAAYAAALDPRWSGLAERVQRAATFVNRAVSEPDSWTGPYIPDAVWADLGYITGQCRAAEDISGG